jgi:hypothetical protein
MGTARRASGSHGGIARGLSVARLRQVGKATFSCSPADAMFVFGHLGKVKSRKSCLENRFSAAYDCPSVEGQLLY